MAVRSNGEILLKPPDELEDGSDQTKTANKLKSFVVIGTSKKNCKKEDPVNLDGINEDQLETLLNEAIQYKTPKDAEQSSDLFRSLLKETTQESGEESPPAIFPVINNPPSKKRRNKHPSKDFSATLAASRTKGGSLQNLNELDGTSGYQCASGGGRRKGKRRGEGSGSSTPNVSARKREGGSLPCGVDRGGLEEDHSIGVKSSRKKKELSKSHSISESKMAAALLEPSAPPPDNELRKVDLRQNTEYVTINMEDQCIADDEDPVPPWNLRHENLSSVDIVDARPILDKQYSDDRHTEIVEMDCSEDERNEDMSMDSKTVDQLSQLRMSGTQDYGTIKRREEVDGEIDYSLGDRYGYQRLPESDDTDAAPRTATLSCRGQSDNLTADTRRFRQTCNERKIEENGSSPPNSERHDQQYPHSGPRTLHITGQGGTGHRLKSKRHKISNEKVIKVEDMADYRGDDTLEDLLNFIEGVDGAKKNDKKANIKEKNGKSKKKLESGEKILNGVLSDGEQKENKKKSRAKSENSAVGILKTDMKHRSSSLENSARSNPDQVSNLHDSDGTESPHSQLSKSTSNDSDKFKTPVGGEISPAEFVSFQPEFVPVLLEESEFRTVTKKSRKKRKSPQRPEKNFGNRRANIHFEEAHRPTHAANDDIALLYRNPRKRSGERRLSSSSVLSGHSGYDSDKDSVHSLPCSSTISRVTLKPVSTSSGSTPQASYADITRKLRGEEPLTPSHVETSKVISVKSKVDVMESESGSPELPKPKRTGGFPAETCDFPPLSDEIVSKITPLVSEPVNPKPLSVKEPELIPEKPLKAADPDPKLEEPNSKESKPALKVESKPEKDIQVVPPEKGEGVKSRKVSRHSKSEEDKKSLPPMFVIGNVSAIPAVNEGLTFGFEINEELLKDKSARVHKTRKNSLNEKMKEEKAQANQEVREMRKVASDKDFAAYYKENLKLDSSKFNFKDIVAYVGREWSFLERKRQGKSFYACNRISP